MSAGQPLNSRSMHVDKSFTMVDRNTEQSVPYKSYTLHLWASEANTRTLDKIGNLSLFTKINYP